MKINKKDVIHLLEQIALYMELKGENSFKISAFRKAAIALEADDRSLSEISTFTEIPGIGKGTEAVIKEFISEGESVVLAELQEEVPKGLIPLLQLPGLGGKKISRLYQELGVTDIDSLKAACESDRVADLKGFGKKSQEKILAAIAQIGKQPERLPIAYMLPFAESIEDYLRNIKEIVNFSRAGSLRRVRETIKDLDFVIAARDGQAVKAALLNMPGVEEATANGETKITLVFAGQYKVSVDFRIVQPEEFASALHHFTGSKDHNIRMRQLAKEQGEKISEYGVEKIETGEVRTFSTEAELYHHFHLPYIPPEIREDGKEIDEYHPDHKLIELKDIKGDLHMHTTWSDGAFSIEEMVEACRKKGYQYMAITDHSEFLRVVNGLSPERLRKQIEEIRILNDQYNDITILAGVEMDILPDGRLNYEDDILAELDIVIASIHSSFSQSQAKIMERLKTALQNPHVDIIAHPTGRLIGRRDGYDVDIALLMKLAKETNTALELNANPARLDLSADHIRRAHEAGIKIGINTDAHNRENLDYMKLGVLSGRKGRLTASSVLNAMPIEELLQFLKRNE
ncbi:DNA polymerase/3'-5' exonuclease PolX [Lederbergia sp. NSJ-179]|uniref:DNA polymerase/3'-5' exonuclease PolX n=1 Tax=Lederbergia sp. NSJ-179 TaxID=2931402 RepID=UPI001FD2DF16|nr:DNA polymerase/3'-5' exonuclease PolX [Lederbergia sp. NSJ-179]MCJ7839815.1 DNA polymerase/3'-5' exonuclease PolX [Lederbergia sp. NSJ-179]